MCMHLPLDFRHTVYSVLSEDRYFVNSKDEIKLIEDPDEDFQYYISKNARHNEKHREAMNGTPA